MLKRLPKIAAKCVRDNPHLLPCVSDYPDRSRILQVTLISLVCHVSGARVPVGSLDCVRGRPHEGDASSGTCVGKASIL
jgi:hypothetical protein